MTNSLAIVVIDSDPARRNAAVRSLCGQCRHVEPYEGPRELEEAWPHAANLIMIHHDEHALRCTLEIMAHQASWLPVVVYSAEPEPTRVVDAIRMGAIDYVGWPLSVEALSERLQQALERLRLITDRQERATRSKRLLRDLSARERQVLFRLAKGATNKTIADDLQISPRTIQIHRANMMGKLGARHLGEAISLALYSVLTEPLHDACTSPELIDGDLLLQAGH